MKTKKNILIAFLLNLCFSIFEFFGGIFTGSIAIASDAVHDFGDAISIGLSYIFEKISHKAPDENYTFGYARFSVLGGFITVCILTIGSVVVIYNAILRIITPTPINYNGMLLFACVGLLVNFVAAYCTHGGHSINQKAVNLHMLEDLLGWIIVLIGAIIMRFANFPILDPILSLCVATFILYHCIIKLTEISRIFLIKTPADIDTKQLITDIKTIEGVLDAYHVHVWTLDGEIRCATLHVTVEQPDQTTKAKIKEKLSTYGISHVTMEMETLLDAPFEKNCTIKKESHHERCHHHH